MFENISTWAPLFWLILAIALGIIEAASFQLVAIWFAVGSAFAIFPAMVGAGIWVQFAVFAVISILCLLFTRPFVKKVLKVKAVKTNADTIIGTIGIVVEDIDNVANTGRVHINGLDWTARSDDGDFIVKDERVLIKAIQGVKVMVERV